MGIDRNDLAGMLRACLASVDEENEDEELRFNVRAFRDMLEHAELGYPLSAKQAAWIRNVYEKLCAEPLYENLVSSGRCPRGREVPTPTVLQNLPKKPPIKTREPEDE